MTNQEKIKEFKKEYNKFLEENKTICVDCLEKKFKKYIGEKKSYDCWMMGNGMVLKKCEECEKDDVGILPYSDLRKAILASLGEPQVWL